MVFHTHSPMVLPGLYGHAAGGIQSQSGDGRKRAKITLAVGSNSPGNATGRRIQKRGSRLQNGIAAVGLFVVALGFVLALFL
ncbi:MAG TPA: hypothetical protein VMF58_05290, partial [Rhizomicrobium sp.]|nr:hypothetical protein [Rhizomicrobium sp.]